MDDIAPRIRQLAADIDSLEAAVAPLLLRQPASAGTAGTAGAAGPAAAGGGGTGGLAAAALHLPLLDKAKLHVLAGFALESALFCSLSLAGVDARSHAVFRELQRVRQYMGKIDAAEKAETAAAAPTPPTSRLDRSAAIRFLKADVDSPAMKAGLAQLLREEQAAAVAETGARGSATDAAPRGRKRGGGAGGPSGRGLTKQPKR